MSKKKSHEQEESLPILTSLGFTKQGGLWVVYTIKTQGDKVVSAEVSNGDTKAIAFEEFKIKAVKEFVEKDI